MIETTIKARLVNLTPHSVTIRAEGGETVVPPSGCIARVETERPIEATIVTPDGHVIKACRSVPGKVAHLPEPQFGVLWIVSAMVRAALPDRCDLVSPGPLVRDEGGQPVGCEGLDINPRPVAPEPEPATGDEGEHPADEMRDGFLDAISFTGITAANNPKATLNVLLATLHRWVDEALKAGHFSRVGEARDLIDKVNEVAEMFTPNEQGSTPIWDVLSEIPSRWAGHWAA